MVYCHGQHSYFLISNENFIYCENLFYLLYICYLIVSLYDFSENIFKSINIISCHKLNGQNEVFVDGFEDYNETIMVPKHLVKEFRQFKSHEEPNSEEIRIVNQENDECIKDIKIGAYMKKAQERELISLLGEHIDTFV